MEEKTLQTILKNGDMIKIITSKNAITPSLTLVVSSQRLVKQELQ